MAVEECVRWALPALRATEAAVQQACAEARAAGAGAAEAAGAAAAGAAAAGAAAAGAAAAGAAAAGAAAAGAAEARAGAAHSLALAARLCGGFAAQLPRWPLAMTGAQSCLAHDLAPLAAGFRALSRAALLAWARLTADSLPPSDISEAETAAEALAMSWRPARG